jgi:hypothetical protein
LIISLFEGNVCEIFPRICELTTGGLEPWMMIFEAMTLIQTKKIARFPVCRNKLLGLD